MNNKETDTEQIILEAAEAEFLEKGYGNARTVSIAERAGVSHSMLHYYFRTKEQLFQRIFQRKVQTLHSLFQGVYDKHLPFQEMLRSIIETQFEFVRQNPRLPQFILNEILLNAENRKLLLAELAPKMHEVIENLDEALQSEASRGNIRPVRTADFLMNMVSMNVASFVALPILLELTGSKDEMSLRHILDTRRESNVTFLLASLRP
jgi:AcrR family transcriptional regulator